MSTFTIHNRISPRAFRTISESPKRFNRFRNIPPSYIDNKKEVTEAEPISKNSLLKPLLAAFSTSAIISIGAHTTSIFDGFGDSVKQGIRFVFDFLSLALGTIAASTYLGIPRNDIQDGTEEVPFLNTTLQD